MCAADRPRQAQVGRRSTAGSRFFSWRGSPQTLVLGAVSWPRCKSTTLTGDVLTISRATSSEVVGPTKSGRIRRLTLGATTAQLWRDSVATWRQRALLEGHGDPDEETACGFGPWLFSRRLDHSTRLTTSCAGHWFADLADRARHPDVTLHRLRHTVATVLVGRGDILQAQQRLGHRDAATTLRIYSHAMPLTDADAAQTLDSLFQ